MIKKAKSKLLKSSIFSTSSTFSISLKKTKKIKYIKKIIILTILIITLLICSCGKNTGSISDATNDKGEGLEIGFDIKQILELGEEKYIQTQINLKNTGFKDVRIRKEDFKIEILEDKKIFENTNWQEEFKKTIFSNSEEIVFAQNYPIIDFEKNIKLDKSFLKNPLNNNIQLELSLKYNYMTKVESSLDINFENFEQQLEFHQIMQSAPVQVDRFEAITTSTKDKKASIKIHLKKIKSTNFEMFIKNLKIQFKIGNDKLECKKNHLEKSIFEENNYYKCEYTFKSKKYNTLLTGEMNYDVELNKISSIQLERN